MRQFIDYERVVLPVGWLLIRDWKIQHVNSELPLLS